MTTAAGETDKDLLELYVWSRFDNDPITYDPFYVNQKFHLLPVCICLVSCSIRGVGKAYSSRDDPVKTRLRITPRARVPRSSH